MQDEVLHIEPCDQEGRQEAEDLQGQDPCLWVVAHQVVLDSLEEDLLVGQECFDLGAALLENLCDNLSTKLVCRVRKDVGHLEDDAVEKLGILVVQDVGLLNLPRSKGLTSVAVVEADSLVLLQAG